MQSLLLLVHRIPYPPNKGDKIRSYHLLKFLATRYRVHLGTFVDQQEDLAHLPALDGFCASRFAVRLDTRSARLRSVAGFLTGEALTLPYYRNAALRNWVRNTVAEHGIRKAVVFSGAMAQYVRDMGLHVVLDFVDVDSAKWKQYADRHVWPSSFVYRREGEKLLSFERCAAAGSAASVFVTRAEAELFIQSAPEFRSNVCVIENGVDSDYFSPSRERASPFQQGETAIVFTGAMDYWPNIDAVSWFAREAFPQVLQQRPDARFYIVGMNPASTVRALSTIPNIVVTGAVPDVRPYVQHAAVVVAPLRVARGVQNKVLEAMSMARPVVVSASAASGVSGNAGVDFLQASSAADYAQVILRLLASSDAQNMGQRARERVRQDYNWDRNMSEFDRLLRSDNRLEAAG